MVNALVSVDGVELEHLHGTSERVGLANSLAGRKSRTRQSLRKQETEKAKKTKVSLRTTRTKGR